MIECRYGCLLICYFLGNILVDLIFVIFFSVLGMEMRFLKNRLSSSLLLLVGKWCLKLLVEFWYYLKIIIIFYFMFLFVFVFVLWWKLGLIDSWEMGLMIIDRFEIWVKNENFLERGWVKKEKNSYICNYIIVLVGW